MHRIGGLEKANNSGDVSYDPENHEEMVRLRARKIAGVTNVLPPLQIEGPDSGDVLVLSWGSTYGACATAVHALQERGEAVTHVSIRYLHPLPADLGGVLSRFTKVLIPELNMGQLRTLIRSEYLVDAQGLNKIQGKPFTVVDITRGIEALLH
jgi:2-oxoglutarate ferredoxin oxidoreductase subunit alpha